MEINNSFDVPLPPADAWKVLMDIPRIAPCMPGAELTGVVDKDTYNGKVSVKPERAAPGAWLAGGAGGRADKETARWRGAAGGGAGGGAVPWGGKVKIHGHRR